MHCFPIEPPPTAALLDRFLKQCIGDGQTQSAFVGVAGVGKFASVIL
jgi:hypothetical protein